MDDVESEQIDRRENARALEAIKTLESEKAIESKSDLKNRCQQILREKGYVLHTPIFGDYWIGPKKGKGNWNYYSNSDLNKIKEWADSTGKIDY